MRINNFSNYAIENVFVGDGGFFSHLKSTTMTLPEIMDKHSMDIVDFLKIDIEGSEFALFDDLDFLDRIKYVALEVHPRYGSPAQLVRKLRKKGFAVSIRDRFFTLIEDMSRAEFVYGSNLELLD